MMKYILRNYLRNILSSIFGLFDWIMNKSFAVRIKRCCCFIKNHYWCIEEHSSCNADSLLLITRECFLGNICAIPIPLLGNVIMNVCNFRCFNYLFFLGFNIAKFYIPLNIHWKHNGFLWSAADILSQWRWHDIFKCD